MDIKIVADFLDYFPNSLLFPSQREISRSRGMFPDVEKYVHNPTLKPITEQL